MQSLDLAPIPTQKGGQIYMKKQLEKATGPANRRSFMKTGLAAAGGATFTMF
jgi:hypothetical protein